MLGITAVLGIGLFFLLPLVIATLTAGDIENDIVQHLVEGLVRVAIFIGYLAVIARTPDIARVFQYHGAEHMTIHALEHNDPLRPEHIRRYPTAHPRCGTEFLVVVIMLSIIAFSLVGRQSPLLMIVSRILLIPVIASIGYELLRLGARHRGNLLVRVIMWRASSCRRSPPSSDGRHDRDRHRRDGGGTPRDGEEIPAGGLELERSPLPLPGETAADVRAAASAMTGSAAEGEAIAPVSADPPLPG